MYLAASTGRARIGTCAALYCSKTSWMLNSLGLGFVRSWIALVGGVGGFCLGCGWVAWGDCFGWVAFVLVILR